MKTLLQICLQVILWIWFQRAVQNVAAGINPTSVSDANLMFEFLLGGAELDKDNNMFLLDEELASMRAARAFLSQINDDVPRGLGPTLQLGVILEAQVKLTPAQFNSLVLGMVYSAYRARGQDNREGNPRQQRGTWGGALLQLANVTVRQLRGSPLYDYGR